MKALRYIGMLLLTLIALFLILGIFTSKKAHFERSIIINAQPAAVQEIVSKFSLTKNWSPWFELDPNMKIVYEGQDGAVGSKYIWNGNKQVGSGSQTLTKNEPGYIENALHFEGSMGGEAIAGMKIIEENGKTKATWSFDSETPFPWNVMNLIMEKFLSPDYEKGLAKLKAYAESVPAIKKYKGYEVKEINSQGHSYVGVRRTIAIKDIPSYFDESMGIVGNALKKAGKEMEGMPTGLYFDFNEKTGMTDMLAGISIKGGGNVPGLTTIDIPAGKDLSVDYFGAYEKTGNAHYAIEDYMKEKGIKNSFPVIEIYMNDPMIVKDTSKWLTQVIYPISK